MSPGPAAPRRAELGTPPRHYFALPQATHHTMRNPHGGPQCSQRPLAWGIRPSSNLLKRRRRAGLGAGWGSPQCSSMGEHLWA